MNDKYAVIMALAAVVGALVAVHVPVAVGIVVILLAIVLRIPLALCCGCFLLAAGLSFNAWHDLDRPIADHVSGVATIVHDPDYIYGSQRSEVKVNGRHVQVFARGANASVLRSMLAGEHVYIEGTTAPLSGVSTSYLRRRHIVAKATLTTARKVDSGNAFVQAVNGTRRLLEGGAQSLPSDKQALLSGFVMGDDRNEPESVQQDFQNSGLAHLLAVSGENVAFVLIVVGPALKRMSIGWRFGGGLGVLVFFGALTRWEPSVIRAEAMAAVVMYGVFVGRPVSIWRTLAFATTASLLLDPFLVGSVGFLMSLGAVCGMALLGKPLMGLLPGPGWLRRSIAYSIAAQVGVLPSQLAVFGGLPLVAVPANVLAEPVAGAIMVWGVIGGALAGVTGGPMATALHWPTHLMLAWVQGVAHRSAHMGLGNWSTTAWWVAFSALAMSMWWRARARGKSSSSGLTGGSTGLPDQVGQ